MARWNNLSLILRSSVSMSSEGPKHSILGCIGYPSLEPDLKFLNYSMILAFQNSRHRRSKLFHRIWFHHMVWIFFIGWARKIIHVYFFRASFYATEPYVVDGSHFLNNWFVVVMLLVRYQFYNHETIRSIWLLSDAGGLLTSFCNRNHVYWAFTGVDLPADIR